MPPLTSMEGVKLHRSTIQYTEQMIRVVVWSRLHPALKALLCTRIDRLCNQLTGFRLKISTSEVRNNGVMQTLHRIWRRGCRRVRTPEGTNKEQRMVPRKTDSSSSMNTGWESTVIQEGSETLKVRRNPTTRNPGLE